MLLRCGLAKKVNAKIMKAKFCHHKFPIPNPMLWNIDKCRTKKKNIHTHKIVHTTAIATLRTPIFNIFSINVILYVNMMDIFNNLSFTQHIRHLICTLITLKIQTSQKVLPQRVEVSNLIESIKIGQLIFNYIFCRFNINNFFLISSPTLNNV